MKFSATIAAAAALLLASAPASALTKFTITGDYSVEFTLPDSPTILPGDATDGVNFGLRAVPGFATSSNGLADILFFNKDVFGGLTIIDNGNGFDWLLDASDNQQYHTGPESAPTFVPGVHDLMGFGTPGEFTLTITHIPDPESAVPEPASWALMIGGFALAGVALRRRQAAKIAFA